MTAVASHRDTIEPISTLALEESDQTTEALERPSEVGLADASRRSQSAEVRAAMTPGPAASRADDVAQLTPKGGRPVGQVLGALEEGGSPLPDPVQTQMEAAFSQDFSSVRVREDSAAKDLGARAFTRGEQVVFSPGQYQPESMAGQRLLAHELAHVVQQREGRVKATQAASAGVTPIVQDTGLEAEADTWGEAAVQMSPERGSAAQASSTAGSGAAVQMESELLTAAKIKSAIKYNQKKLSADIVAAIGGNLGAGGAIDDAFCLKVAEFQKAKGLSVDGKVGGNTLRALSKTMALPLVSAAKMDAAIAYNEKRLALPLIYRIEALLGRGANGVITPALVQAIAAFQLQQKTGVDGWCGPGTERYMKKAGLVTDDLKGHYWEYGKMFQDSLLDITVGQGFDENDWDVTTDPKLRSGISGLGFSEDQGKVEELIKKSGKTPSLLSGFNYFFKENIADYNGKKVNAVIRYAPSRAQSGAERKASFVQGLQQSDVAIYTGHARYGTGPDFDRNFRIELMNKDGMWLAFPDYSELEEDLKREAFVAQFGNYTGSPLAIIKKMKADGIFKLNPSNDGNVVINTKSPYSAETFGSYLISLAASSPDAQQPIDPSLIKDENYRLWIFSGCSTKMYVNSVRKNQKNSKSYNTKNLDLLVTNQPTWTHLSADHVLAFLTGIVNMESIESVKKRWDAVKTIELEGGKKKEYHNRGALRSDGVTDNPSVR
jgi:hypothetical protein